MKPRTSLALVLLALLALGVVLFWERGLPGTDERRERRGMLLPDVDAEGVERIAVVRDGETLALEKADEDWWLREPIEDRADRYRVEQLIRDLIEAEVTGRIAADRVQGGDEATGLGDGAVRIELSGAEASADVEIGARRVPGGLRYARLAGDDRLALVRERLTETLSVTVQGLRDKTLVSASTVDMRRLVVERSGERFLELVRGGTPEHGESWRLVHPIEDAADRGRVTTLLSELVALRADAFVDVSPAEDAGLDPADWRFVVELAEDDGEQTDGRVVEIALGREAVDGSGLRFASISNREALFEVMADALLALLSRPLESFRSMMALDLTTWDVAEVEITRAGDTLTVARVDDEFDPESKWRAVSPAGFPLDAAAFDRTLSELARIEAKRLADDVSREKAGLVEPVAMLTLRYEDALARPPVTLEIGGPAGAGEVFARRSGRATTLVIEQELATKIDTSRIRRDPS
ncbi:MAG: DUF4340 domain-containing protein [Acidobacteriota bacterium]|nr:DUF4340 domain-containing protein [Acidobacteriota bacterium]